MIAYKGLKKEYMKEEKHLKIVMMILKGKRLQTCKL